MDALDILREASGRIRGAVAGLAGTAESEESFGRGAGGDISRRIDIAAEEAVLACLRERGFPCVVLGEECGRVELPGDPRGHVIMDAIDGSANAVRGVPFYCSSLAFAEGDTLSSVTAAVVADLAGGGTYWAEGGGGAFLDGRPIRVRDRDPVYRTVCVNTSGASAGLLAGLQPVFENNHTRHLGANALEMALFAAGSIDVLVDLRGRLRVQDVAAGYLIAREAGGLVLDAGLGELDSGLGYDARISYVAASGRQILDEVMGGASWDRGP